MVTFDAREPGTPEGEWLRDDRWGGMEPLDVDGVRAVVVLSAHPDDETLAAGGLIAELCGRGAAIRLVVATNGEASHPRSPTRTPEALASIRREELRAAAKILAPGATVEFLGVPDGRLREEGGPARDRLADVVAEAARAVGAGRVLLLAPWAGDGHRDHRAAGCLARDIAGAAGVRLLEYPVWMWHWGDPAADSLPWPEMVRHGLTDSARAAKAEAMARHVSQVAPLSGASGDEAMLTPGFRSHFERDFEVFIRPPEITADCGEPASLTESFFDEFYAGRDDPWRFESRWYERRKRAITMASLPRERYGSALEVGCSIGVLTEALAGRCDRLLAVDIAAAPLRRAAERLRASAHVSFARRATPAEWPAGEFDLVVLSEVGYYWGARDLETGVAKAVASLAPDGVLLACHWRHDVPEYPSTGDAVHAALRARGDLVATVRHEEEDFVLEVFSRPPATSVARETGLVP